MLARGFREGGFGDSSFGGEIPQAIVKIRLQAIVLERVLVAAQI